MLKENQPIPVGTVVKFKIWDTEKDGQGIGIILGHNPRLGHETIYRVHFKRFPDLVYRNSDPFELTISQSDIKEVLDTGARVCSATSKPMNEGWLWGDGNFYTKEEKDTLAECRKDRESILHWAQKFTQPNQIQIEEDFEEFTQCLDRALNNKESDEDLLKLAFEIDFVYYTDWELDEEVRNGDGWFVLDGETDSIFDIFNYSLVRNAFEEIDNDADPIGYDDELTSERMEEISNTEGPEDIECEDCGHVNTHDTDKFGFCVECLNHIV